MKPCIAALAAAFLLAAPTLASAQTQPPTKMEKQKTKKKAPKTN